MKTHSEHDCIDRTGIPYKVRVQELPDHIVKRFSSYFRGSKITWRNPDGCLWFTAWMDNKLVGVAAYVEMNFKARLKSAAVLKEYQGRGIYSELFDMRERIAKQNGMIECNAYSNSNSIGTFMRKGYAVRSEIKRPNNRVTKVVFKKL